MKPEIERRLTLRSRLPLYLIGVLAFLQLIEPDPVWMALLVGLCGLVGISYIWAREMRDKIQAERTSRGNWIVVGDRVQEKFRLRNGSSFPLLWATVTDHSDVPGYAIDRAVAVDARGSYAWQAQGVCTKRGVFTLGPWSLSLGDPLGLFDVSLSYPEVRTLMVYPRVMRLPEFRLPRGSASGRASRALPAPTEALLARTVRHYVPGDSLHLVHWRKTAQLGKLMIRQFDQEPAGALWLVLDLDAAVQAGEGQESTLEYGVILAASLAAKHLDENRAVGLVALGREAKIVPPQPGRGNLWQLLHALTHAEAAEGWPLARVLKQIRPDIGRGRTVLVITSSSQTDWVGELLQYQRRDITTAALLLDAASFTSPREEGQAELPATAEGTEGGLAGLQNLLADYGVFSRTIAQGYPFTPLVAIKRKRKVLKTLFGTGRVITVEMEEEV
ncbi:MAG TPA: DUF58 domain-containing protein [Caldilineae bacterium]|nr:DUF58 domain-containing protein [Caldilineae bacterium]